MPAGLLDLGDPGRAWVRDSLAAGKLLSRHVLGRLNIDEGSTFALGLSEEEGHDQRDLELSLGDLSESLLEASAESLLALITELRNKGNAHLFVVENDLAKPDDPAIVGRPLGSVVFAADTVYHLQDLADLDTQDGLIKFLGSSASGYPLNGFVMRSKSNEELSQAFRTKRLGPVIAGIDAIVNSVFDNSGFSVWLPNIVLEQIFRQAS